MRRCAAARFQPPQAAGGHIHYRPDKEAAGRHVAIAPQKKALARLLSRPAAPPPGNTPQAFRHVVMYDPAHVRLVDSMPKAFVATMMGASSLMNRSWHRRVRPYSCRHGSAPQAALRRQAASPKDHRHPCVEQYTMFESPECAAMNWAIRVRFASD